MEKNRKDKGEQGKNGRRKMRKGRDSAEQDWGERSCGRACRDGRESGIFILPRSDPRCLSLPHPRRVSWCFDLNGFHSCQLSVIHHKIKQQSFKETRALERAGLSQAGRWEVGGASGTGAHF